MGLLWMAAILDLSNMAPTVGAQLGNQTYMTLATSGLNLVLVERFEQFKGEYWLSPLTKMKWNEWGFKPPLCTYRLNWARRTSWGSWEECDYTYCTPDTWFEIRALAVWGRARYFSVTKAPHNIKCLRVSREESSCFFETWRPEWGSNPRSLTFQAGSFNHPTAPGPPPLGFVGISPFLGYYPAKTRHWDNVVLMLARRLRRLSNIKTTLSQCLVLAG